VNKKEIVALNIFIPVTVLETDISPQHATRRLTLIAGVVQVHETNMNSASTRMSQSCDSPMLSGVTTLTYTFYFLCLHPLLVRMRQYAYRSRRLWFCASVCDRRVDPPLPVFSFTHLPDPLQPPPPNRTPGQTAGGRTVPLVGINFKQTPEASGHGRKLSR